MPVFTLPQPKGIQIEQEIDEEGDLLFVEKETGNVLFYLNSKNGKLSRCDSADDEELIQAGLRFDQMGRISLDDCDDEGEEMVPLTPAPSPAPPSTEWTSTKVQMRIRGEVVNFWLDKASEDHLHLRFGKPGDDEWYLVQVTPQGLLNQPYASRSEVDVPYDDQGRVRELE